MYNRLSRQIQESRDSVEGFCKQQWNTVVKMRVVKNGKKWSILINKIDSTQSNLVYKQNKCCRSWLTNDRWFYFTTRNVQHCLCASLRAFKCLVIDYMPPKVLCIFYNSQVNSSANILPSNWFRLGYLPIFYPLKCFPRFLG